MLKKPIFWVILILIVIVAVYFYIYKGSDSVDSVVDSMKSTGQEISTTVKDKTQQLSDKVKSAVDSKKKPMLQAQAHQRLRCLCLRPAHRLALQQHRLLPLNLEWRLRHLNLVRHQHLLLHRQNPLLPRLDPPLKTSQYFS